MKNSVITKYFGICSALILSSIVCIGAVMIITTLQMYKTEKNTSLKNGASELTSATSSAYVSDGSLNPERIKSLYLNYSSVTDCDVALVGTYGSTVASTDDLLIQRNAKISGSIINKISDGGFFSVGDMDGYFTDNCFSYASSVYLGAEEYYVIIYTSYAPYNNYMWSLVRMFIVIFIVATILTFAILYTVTRNMMKPVREMTEAAEHFGKGDFSQKLNISESNEFGALAASMNNMAYSLSVLEDSRKSFIANISHELKTPMTSIGGFVDGILDGTIPPDQHRHYLTIVSEEVNRLARMVRSMLNISKYESGEVKMKFETFDITSLTIMTVLLFEKRISERHVDVIGLDTEPHYICADIDLVQQIIYNLVENAIKFVNIGGYISFRFVDDGEKTQVAIRNSGGGLTEEEIPKVFERFYKTDESHGKDKTGVGLGLAIVRSIINLHGGSILVKSRPDEYTEFSFRLNSAEPPERTPKISTQDNT